LFLLSTSLSDLVFEPGQPIPNYVTNSLSSKESGETIVEVKEWKTQSFLKTLLPLLIIIVFIILIISLIKMKDIIHVLKLSLFLVIPLILAILLNWIPDSPKPIGSYTSSEGVQTTPTNYDYAQIGPPPDIIFRIIGISLLLLFAGLIIFFLIKRKKLINKQNTLADETDNAIKAIEYGHSVDNVIIYCYTRMSEIIIETRGIERKSYLTPREFEKLLVSEGIPLSPIQQLTKVFEEIRYGNKSLDHQAQNIALASLKEIRNYLQKETKVT